MSKVKINNYEFETYAPNDLSGFNGQICLNIKVEAGESLQSLASKVSGSDEIVLMNADESVTYLRGYTEVAHLQINTGYGDEGPSAIVRLEKKPVSEQVEKNKANIDYVAAMTGVDLDE